MNRNEQIEEMSWIITFKAFEQAHLENGDDYLSDIVATELYDKDYRKASEVARVIFKNLRVLGYIDFDGNFCIRKDSFEELEKKFTEADEENA